MNLLISLVCILVTIVKPALLPNRPLLSILQNAPKPGDWILRNRRTQTVIETGLDNIRNRLLPDDHLNEDFWRTSEYSMQAFVQSAATANKTTEDFICDALSDLKTRIESDGKTKVDEQYWQELNSSLQASPKDAEGMTVYFENLLARQNPGLGQQTFSFLNESVPTLVHNATQVAVAVPLITIGVITAPIRFIALAVIFIAAACNATQTCHF